MNNQLFYLVLFLAAVNLASFCVMYLDKVRSRKVSAQRIPEGVMFFAAAAFGSLGILAGMFVFRHKTAKWYFLVGIPLLAVQNVATLYSAYSFFLNK